MGMDLRFRQIHLDFHTSIAIDDVGRDFNADEFGDRMAEARVNSATVFAKCHHGLLYYNTKHEARHPGLKKGLDLLGEQIEALHRRDIRAPIYISVHLDEYAAERYPQWRAIDENGQLFNWPFGVGWHAMCMASPYQDYLADQIQEVLKKFAPTDGIFLDICGDLPTCTKWSVDGMRAAGLDPTNADDRDVFARRVVHQYQDRYNKMIYDAHKTRKVLVWYNSRPLVRVLEEKKHLQHVEIEALPTGGWGYTYLPLNARLANTFGLQFLGMTSRFHKSWGDFGGLKPSAALRHECCQSLAYGGRCSVGDQLHLRGTLSKKAYEQIGDIYRYVESCEPWCEGASQLTQIAVLRRDHKEYHLSEGSELGALRALQELAHLFDFRVAGYEGDLTKYDLVIVPGQIPVDDKLVAKLQAYVKGGGALLIAGDAAVRDGKPIVPQLGIDCDGPSPYQTTFMRFDRSIAGDMGEQDHVMYERGWRMRAVKGAKSLGRIVEPYFDRTWEHFCSHFQTPPAKATRYSVAVENQPARCGKIITISFPVFYTYAMHGNLPYRHLIQQCIDRLLPDPLIRRQAPSHVETTLSRRGKQTIMHVLSACPIRRTPTLDIIEEPTPLVDAKFSVKLDRAPKHVTLQPRDEPIPFIYKKGRADITLTTTTGHEMVVFE